MVYIDIYSKESAAQLKYKLGCASDIKLEDLVAAVMVLCDRITELEAALAKAEGRGK